MENQSNIPIAQIKPFHPDKRMDKLHTCLKPIRAADFQLYDVEITEVLGSSDHRRSLPTFSEAKRK